MSPKPDVLAFITKKLSMLRDEARDYLVENGLAVPKLPLWGKNNNPEEWLNANDFEILSAAYRHEVEGFLKRVAPYFPKERILRNPNLVHLLVFLIILPLSANFLLLKKLRP